MNKALARLDSIGNDIKDGKFTFEAACSYLSEDKDTRNNHGLMAYTDNQTGKITSRFQMKDLPTEVARVVDTMKVGEISQAFRMMDAKTGREVCAIVKLKSRIESHPANLTEDFQVLREQVLRKRQNALLQKWIEEKIKSTYVRIDPAWRNHKFTHQGWIK